MFRSWFLVLVASCLLCVRQIEAKSRQIFARRVKDECKTTARNNVEVFFGWLLQQDSAIYDAFWTLQPKMLRKKRLYFSGLTHCMHKIIVNIRSVNFNISILISKFPHFHIPCLPQKMQQHWKLHIPMLKPPESDPKHSANDKRAPPRAKKRTIALYGNVSNVT